MDKDLKQFKKLIEETQQIDNFVKNGLIYVRKEHEKALVLCYEHLMEFIRKIYKKLKAQNKQESEELIGAKNNFKTLLQNVSKEILDRQYNKHMQSLEQDFDHLCENPDLSKYQLEQKFLHVKLKIQISQLAYQQLFTYMDHQGLIYLQNFLKTTIQSPNEPKNIEQEYQFLEKNTQIQVMEHEKMVKKQIITRAIDPSRNGFELGFWRKLDASMQRHKGNNDQKIFQRVWNTLTPAEQDPTENMIEKEYNVPIMKPKDHINLVQSFLDRKTLTKNNRPNIINVKLDDTENNINCLEILPRGNILLAGTSTGCILLFNLTKQQQGQQQQNEENNNNAQKNQEIVGNTKEQKKLLKQQQQAENEKNNNTFEKENIDNNEKIEAEQRFEYDYRFMGHTGGQVTCLSLLYDELYFLSAGTDHQIKLWCLRSKQQLTVYKLHQKTIWNIQFAPLGLFFVSSSADKTAALWTTDKLNPQFILQGHQSDVIQSQFAPDLRNIYTASLDYTIRVWRIIKEDDETNPKCVECLKIFIIDFQISCMNLSFDGTLLALGGVSGEVQTLDLLEATLKEKIFFEVEGKRYQIVDLQFSMDQSELAVASHKTFVSYQNEQLMNTQSVDIYQDFYAGKKTYEQKKIENRFIHANPLDLMEVQENRTEQFVKIAYHPKNYIILISK